MNDHDSKTYSPCCFTTLTCNDRKTLPQVIRAVLQNTSFSTCCDWIILLQGCTDAYIRMFLHFLAQQTANNNTGIILVDLHPGTPDAIKKRYKPAMPCLNDDDKQVVAVRFVLRILEKNVGLSKGNNILAECAKPYTYVVNLEDDWILLPPSFTAVSNNWLTQCLAFMDKYSSVSTLFLRQYSTEKEKLQYGWTRNIPYSNHKFALSNFNYAEKMRNPQLAQPAIQLGNEILFRHIPQFLFSFNPTLRRNNDYYQKAKIFPLVEYEDINTRKQNWSQTKLNTIPAWGNCEAVTMELHRDLTTFYVQDGLFVHHEDCDFLQ